LTSRLLVREKYLASAINNVFFLAIVSGSSMDALKHLFVVDATNVKYIFEGSDLMVNTFVFETKFPIFITGAHYKYDLAECSTFVKQNFKFCHR